METFIKGLLTGLVLQLGIGPVFFYIVNLTLQKTIFDGLAAAVGVTLGDYFYITLAILGIGKVLEKKEIKKIFGIISSIVLIAFGAFMIKNITGVSLVQAAAVNTSSLFSSFISTFFLTISSPLTVVLFTGLFAAKAVENNYTKKELAAFGVGTGLATFLFMGSSVIIFSLVKGAVPVILIQLLNIIVGGLLIGYGGIRLVKVIKNRV